MQKVLSIVKAKSLNIDLIFPVLAFSIPFILSGPQWLTGTFVNCYLFLYVSSLSQKYKTLAIILPSIAALLHGAVFGPFTPFLIYFLPFIWLGNLILVSIFERTKSLNYSLRIILSSISKSVFLLSFAFIYVGLGIVPKLFMTSMGLIQLLTALLGGFLSLIILKII